MKETKNEKNNEQQFLSILNEIIANNDLNYNCFVIVFKEILSGNDGSEEGEEEIINNLQQILLEVGYEIKDKKLEHTTEDFSFEKNSTTTKIENILLNSLSELNKIKNTLIILSVSPINIYIKNNVNYEFDKLWQEKKKNSLFSDDMENLELVYFSNNKVRGLFDTQYMFPEFFKVKHIFQIIFSKVALDGAQVSDFNDSLDQYKNNLLYNSIYVADSSVYERLSHLSKDIHKNIDSIKANDNLFIISQRFIDFINNYVDNDRFQEYSCAVTHLTYIGNNDSFKKYSTEIAFNDNFFSVNFSNEKEYDELLKLFIEMPRDKNYFLYHDDKTTYKPKNYSTYQRILIIFKPFICRNNLNNVLLNIFTVNGFNILHRKFIVLNDDEINYLYGHECPNKEMPIETYYHIMSDANCEIVLLTKFRAFSEAHAILGNKKNLSGVKGQHNNTNFQNIFSLINNQILNLINKKNASNKNLLKPFNNNSKSIREDFIKFCSKINLYFYLNDNIYLNQEEINYFCPEFCSLKDIILICKYYSKKLEDTLLLFKYEILDKCYYRFNEYEIDKILKDNKNISNQTLIKRSFLQNDFCLMRIIKPGSAQEFQNLFFDRKKFFGSFCNTSKSSKTNSYLDNKYEFIRENCYLVTSFEMFEYLYPIINEQINKIEGNILINNTGSEENNKKIYSILSACIKNTVGEEIRKGEKPYNNEHDSIFHRLIYFYHYDFFKEKKSNIYLNCLYDYYDEICKKIMNKIIGTKMVNSHYSELCDDYYLNKEREILNTNFSFIVESNNLGFYEIRIPLINFYTSRQWSYLENDRRLLLKNYLYSDYMFYNDLAKANKEKNICVLDFPFNINADIDKKELFKTYIGEEYIYKIENDKNDEEFKNIIRYIFYKTKFESNKIFNQKCITTMFQKTIVPRNYHYRIEPNTFSLINNRIYEVEEFTGFSFIEMVIQDYMKFRPMELNKTINDIEGNIFRKTYDYRYRYDEKQYPLTAFLWGKKLNKICKIIEDQRNNLNSCDNYGSIVYIPIENKLSGIIDKCFMKDYEIFLYLNMFEDIKSFMHSERDFYYNLSKNKDRNNNNFEVDNNLREKEELEKLEQTIEKKLYEIFNSDIFNKTRKDIKNIKLLPTRIEPNNIRINKALNYNERTKSKSSFDEIKEISNININYEKEYHEIFKTTEETQSIFGGIINKNISLTDIFCYNGIKYHMFAALYYLINVTYKKLNRQTKLISLYFDRKNINYREINSEYDVILDSILKGFLSESYINYKDFNDEKRYNAYLIEYFFYCMSEIKYYINEIYYFEEKIERIEKALQIKYKNFYDYNVSLEDDNDIIKNDKEEYFELTEIKKDMIQLKSSNIRYINIILDELLDCPLQQSEDELSDYISIYVPKERYYIPMYLKEKWERNLDNEKYRKVERVNKYILDTLQNLKKENERKIYETGSYNIANDYYLVEKSYLREPDPEISDKILLERKKKEISLAKQIKLLKKMPNANKPMDGFINSLKKTINNKFNANEYMVYDDESFKPSLFNTLNNNFNLTGDKNKTFFNNESEIKNKLEQRKSIYGIDLIFTDKYKNDTSNKTINAYLNPFKK